MFYGGYPFGYGAYYDGYPYGYSSYYYDEGGCYVVHRKVKIKKHWRIRRIVICN
ncbi:MAG: hypothetical protein WAV72_27145 [Bradyrhizobium sp.]